MSYLEVFGVLTGVGVDVSKIFRVGAGAGVLTHEAGAESESEKCDSAHLCCKPLSAFRYVHHKGSKNFDIQSCVSTSTKNQMQQNSMTQTDNCLVTSHSTILTAQQ